MKTTLGVFLVCAATVIACAAGDGTTGGGVLGGGSDASTADGGTGGGATDGGSSGGSSCALSDGVYTITYTKTGGMASCATPQPQTFTVDSSKTKDAGATGMLDPRCTMTKNDATCEFVTKCNIDTNGYVTKTESSFKTSGSSATGSSKSTTLGPDGGVISDCSYALTYTKK
jgi:hypothetical protein